MQSDFEQRLIAAIQPIRHFFLAQCIEYFMSSGLMDQLIAAPGTTPRKLAAEAGADPERVAALLRYLSVEGLVRDPEGAVEITAKGRELAEFRPWYELLIGGYGSTLQQLPEVMADSGRFASRNGALVGRGSCGMSRYDAIPLVRRLLDRLPERPATLVDLGCGDGTFLLELCAGEIPGIGVDPDAGSIANARRTADAQGQADRVRFVAAPAEQYMADHAAGDAGTPCFVMAFSLQEILEQQGRPATVDVVRRALDCAPGASLAIVEVEHRPLDPGVMAHGLGLGYYNPYYLIHQITEQRLESRAFWADVIVEAGGRVVETLTTAPEVDSTGLELGFLVTR